MASRNGDKSSQAASRSPRSPVQQRLHDGFLADRRFLSQMVGDTQDERKSRIQAVMELKQDLDASSARIAAQSSMVRAQQQAEKAEQARTHQDLVNQGKNPYEIARRKVVERQARKERARIDRNIHDRESKLLSRLEADKVETRKREKVEAANRAYEKKYQREMGRAAQEERTRAYLLSRTGRETLDPTGKMVRVYPSQETNITDHTFGLGQSAVLTPEHRKRIVSKVHSKPPHIGTEPNPLLLPRRKQQDAENETVSPSRTEEDSELKASERLTMPPIPGAKPGQDSRKVNHALLPPVNDVKLPPLTGNDTRRLSRSRGEDDEENNALTSDTASGNSSKCKKSRGRSVLEERQLAKAREKQRDKQFAQPQVVWGKTFKGSAFLSNPQTLWFKDFDVGRPLTLNFTLTNVSNTFNQFKLLPMDDEVCELFEIVYERPGRMSAGMSCSLRMTFTGMERRDLDTTLSVAAPTGVVQVPVRCTCKKAVPVLDQRVINFPETVAGERSTIALTLDNQGALPLEYRVRRVKASPTPREETTSPLEIDTNVEKEKQSDDMENDAVDTNEPTGPGNKQDLELDPAQEDTQAIEPDNDPLNGNADSDGNNDRSKPPSRTTSAASSKTSALRVEAKDDDIDAKRAANNEEFEPLNPEEQELLDRAQEITLFKPEGAEEPIRYKRHGIVEPYSTDSVSFSFAPSSAITLENEQFVIEFPAAGSSGMLSPDLRRLASIPIQVSGVALQVPIYAAQQRLDFRCCAYGKLYRHQLAVHNRGKVALKIQVQVPTPLAGYLEFNPGFGFVQAAVGAEDGQFLVQIKFRPQEHMWKRVERAGMGSRALGMLAVPVPVLVPDQVVPVFFLFTVRLTSTTLQLHVHSEGLDNGLHFGNCCVGHSISHELILTNSSRLPQRVGITKLPKDVIVADATAGVGLVLLPEETRKLSIVYQPSFAGILKATGSSERAKPTLVLWSSTFNQEYRVPCSGVGVASDLVFSNTVVRLGATAVGQTQTCNLKLTNSSDQQTLLAELRPPPEASPYLKITPLVVRLAPGESVRLEIDFEPTQDIFQLVDNCYFDCNKKHDGNIGDLNSALSVRAEMSAEQPEPRSLHHVWTVLCFQQFEQESNSTQPTVSSPLNALEIRTTVVEPSIVASPTTLDFGQVAIGQTLVRELMLEATIAFNERVLLRAEPLHILGAFRIIGALREVSMLSERERKRVVSIEFEPLTSLIYEDELELSALGTRIRVHLRGVGINPSLSLTPVDGKIDFQDVLARTRNTRELVLANGSAFPLAFSIVPSVGEGSVDKREDAVVSTTGQPVFTFSPANAIIPANSSVTIQVAFQPDHQRPGHYSQRFRIKVPNEGEHHFINLSGRCWENQLYVFAPTATSGNPGGQSDSITRKQTLLTPRPVEDLFDIPPSILLSQLPSATTMNTLPAAGLRKPSSTFILTFDGENQSNGDSGEITSGRQITQTLFIGSTAPSSGSYGGLDDVVAASAGGSAGTFELSVDGASAHVKLFTLEPARGAIAAGQQLGVQVTYNPPASAVTSAFADAAPASNSARTSGAVATGATTERMNSAKRRPDLEVVQWAQVQVQCVLKGGALWRTLASGATAPVTSGGATSTQQQKGGNAAASPGDAADTRIVNVVLRARLQT